VQSFQAVPRHRHLQFQPPPPTTILSCRYLSNFLIRALFPCLIQQFEAWLPPHLLHLPIPRLSTLPKSPRLASRQLHKEARPLQTKGSPSEEVEGVAILALGHIPARQLRPGTVIPRNSTRLPGSFGWMTMPWQKLYVAPLHTTSHPIQAWLLTNAGHDAVHYQSKGANINYPSDELLSSSCLQRVSTFTLIQTPKAPPPLVIHTHVSYHRQV